MTLPKQAGVQRSCSKKWSPALTPRRHCCGAGAQDLMGIHSGHFPFRKAGQGLMVRLDFTSTSLASFDVKYALPSSFASSDMAYIELLQKIMCAQTLVPVPWSRYRPTSIPLHECRHFHSFASLFSTCCKWPFNPDCCESPCLETSW